MLTIRLNELVADDARLVDRPSADLAILESDAQALLRVSETAAELDLIARYYALTDRPAIGVSFVKRALALDSSCALCLDTLALLSFKGGDVAAAVSAQRKAIQMMSESGVPPGMTARLRRYQTLIGRPR